MCKIQSAKRDYIYKTLTQNSRNPRRFWKFINQMLNGSKSSLESVRFIDPDTLIQVPAGSEANFLNDYFCNISTHLGLNVDAPIDRSLKRDLDNMYGFMDTVFVLEEDIISTGELEYLVSNIDTSKNSCVIGITASMCKDIMTFLPVHIICLFNRSIHSGIFPYEWSEGIVTVIPKSGKLADPSNWRPITQTPIFEKVFEKLIQRRIFTYFDENEILSPYQYGFRPHRSTHESDFDLTKFIYTGLNNKKIISAVCLDVCKAFDCINHDILLAKMRKIGFNDVTLSWFKSYLSRTQVVKFNDILSNVSNVRTGIGQGTILGPLIFIFYINDITQSIENLKINMYADDCILFNSENNWNRMFECIQTD